jgi:hypothetical protein
MKSITSTLEKLLCGKLMAGFVGGRIGEQIWKTAPDRHMLRCNKRMTNVGACRGKQGAKSAQTG